MMICQNVTTFMVQTPDLTKYVLGRRYDDLMPSRSSLRPVGTRCMRRRRGIESKQNQRGWDRMRVRLLGQHLQVSPFVLAMVETTLLIVC